eukprot:UN18815
MYFNTLRTFKNQNKRLLTTREKLYR